MGKLQNARSPQRGVGGVGGVVANQLQTEGILKAVACCFGAEWLELAQISWLAVNNETEAVHRRVAYALWGSDVPLRSA